MIRRVMQQEVLGTVRTMDENSLSEPGAGSWPGDCVGDLGRREDDLGEGMDLRVENCGRVYKAIHTKNHTCHEPVRMMAAALCPRGAKDDDGCLVAGRWP